jgi:hypothetical protein
MLKFITNYLFGSNEPESSNVKIYIGERDHVIQVKYLNSNIYNFVVETPTYNSLISRVQMEPDLKNELENLHYVISKITTKEKLNYKTIVIQNFNCVIKFYITQYTNDKVLEIGFCDNEFDQNYFDNNFPGIEISNVRN